jgi:hypothetical protein
MIHRHKSIENDKTMVTKNGHGQTQILNTEN